MVDIFFTVYNNTRHLVEMICDNISPGHINLGEFIALPKYIKVEVRWWNGQYWNTHYIDFPRSVLNGKYKDVNKWIEKQRQIWRHGK